MTLYGEPIEITFWGAAIIVRQEIEAEIQLADDSVLIIATDAPSDDYR